MAFKINLSVLILAYKTSIESEKIKIK